MNRRTNQNFLRMLLPGLAGMLAATSALAAGECFKGYHDTTGAENETMTSGARDSETRATRSHAGRDESKAAVCAILRLELPGVSDSIIGRFLTFKEYST